MLIRGVDPLEEDGTIPDLFFFFFFWPVHGIAGEVARRAGFGWRLAGWRTTKNKGSVYHTIVKMCYFGK